MTIRTSPDFPMRVATTTPRATGASATTSFRTALSETAGVVLSGIEGASSLIPGGGTVAAAVRGAAAPLMGAGGTGTGTAEAPAVPGAGGEAGSVQNALQQSADQNMQFLQLQQQMQAENVRYSALSN